MKENLSFEHNMIDTERLRLRPFSSADIPAVAQLAGERDISKYTLNIPHPYTLDDARKWIGSHDQDLVEFRARHFAICCVEKENQLIGAVSLMFNPDHNRAEMGYWLGKPFWGNGYATEAAQALLTYGFEELSLHRIHAFCFKENLASARVLEKIGMVYEGCMSQHVKKWDRYHDLNIYGIVRSSKDTIIP